MTVAGYAVGGVLALGVAIYQLVNVQGGEYAQAVGAGIGLFLIIFALAGVAIHVAIFKDSAYLRTTRERWNPEWWKYIGFGIGVPILTFIALDFGLETMYAIVAAMMVHAMTSWIEAMVYIYKRHQYVGVP